jgi:NAD dependent epimerase/dehydratase family enzyme
VYTTKSLAKAINQSQDKPKVFVVLTGVGAYQPSDNNKYDESSPTTGIDFFSRLTVEWEKAAYVDPPVRLVRFLEFVKK